MLHWGFYAKMGMSQKSRLIYVGIGIYAKDIDRVPSNQDYAEVLAVLTAQRFKIAEILTTTQKVFALM